MRARIAASGGDRHRANHHLAPPAVLLIALASFTICAQSATAQQTPAATDASAQPAPARQTPGADGSQSSAQGASAKQDSSTGNPPLQGGVQKVELSLEHLRDVGLDLKHLLKGASTLYDEVTVQPVTIITEPEVIAGGTIINIPIGTRPAGPPQPARKERVDLSMNEIRPIVKLLKDNVDKFLSGERQINLPPSIESELSPQFNQWAATVNSIAAQEARLEQLTQAPPYNNGAIAEQVSAMQKNVKDLDKTRRSIYKVIQKEGKRISKLKADS